MTKVYKYYQYGKWRNGVIIENGAFGDSVRAVEKEARKEYGGDYTYIKAIAGNRKGWSGYLLVGTPK